MTAETINPRTPRAVRGLPSLRAGAQYGVLWATLALFTVLAVTTPGFATTDNLRNLLDQQATVLIVAAPLTLAVIAGVFDVSASAVYVLAPLAAIQVQNQTGSIPLAVLVALTCGVLCGAVNATFVVLLRVNSFIATLATSYVFFGVGYLVSDQAILTPGDAAFRDLATKQILGVTSATWLAALVVGITWFLLTRSRMGRYVYATGANPDAARLSGIRTGGIVAATLVLVGTSAGFAGLVNASQGMSAQATDDFGFVFTVIAAVVVGGTSIAGGSGAVWRTVVGAVFIAMIGNGLNLNQIDPIYQRIILGVVILLAVALDATARRRLTN
ncbi:ABC transporter permease [Nocardioides sp. LHD-245]|uniref:ABC transporter permease n=1 Tax=Nocardioides sp. LHD-245 TaxID=3051387 RepID=UPI0027E13F2B|nr:ABC transporter permease [Nocardioides sp. LHD-245]